MVNFVPEDIRPEEAEQKLKSDDFEIEMVQPQQTSPARPSTSPKPISPPPQPLVNPWIGGGIEEKSNNSVVDLTPEGFSLGDGISSKISSSEEVVFKESLLKKRLTNIVNKVKEFVTKIANSKVILGSEIVPRKNKIPAKTPVSNQPEVEISLMPDNAPVTQRMIYERILILLAVATFMFLLVFLGWSWVNWRTEIARTQIAQVKAEMVVTENKINTYNDSLKEIKLLQKQSTRAIDLLKNHAYWTKFFALLEAHTIPDVYFPSFTAKFGDKITLPAVARDLISVARQLAAFYGASDLVQDVNIVNMMAGPKGVNFDVNLTLQPKVLTK
jgi:Tfp pilus assembly protein PilN